MTAPGDVPEVHLSEGWEWVGVGEQVRAGKDYVFSVDGPLPVTTDSISSSSHFFIRRKPAPKVLTFDNVSVTQTKARRVDDGALVLLEFRPDSVCCMNEGCLDFTYGEVCEKYTLPNGRPLTDLIGGDQ